jgi:hypothetical protein
MQKGILEGETGGNSGKKSVEGGPESATAPYLLQDTLLTQHFNTYKGDSNENLTRRLNLSLGKTTEIR